MLQLWRGRTCFERKSKNLSHLSECLFFFSPKIRLSLNERYKYKKNPTKSPIKKYNSKIKRFWMGQTLDPQAKDKKALAHNISELSSLVEVTVARRGQKVENEAECKYPACNASGRRPCCDNPKIESNAPNFRYSKVYCSETQCNKILKKIGKQV